MLFKRLPWTSKPPEHLCVIDPAYPYRQNIVACWVFDRINGVMRDVSGNGYDAQSGNNNGGTFTASATTGPSSVTTPIGGRCADFDGVQDCFEVTSSVATGDRMQKPTCFLFRGSYDETGDVDARIIDKSDSGGGANGWMIEFNRSQNDRLEFIRRSTSGGEQALRVRNYYTDLESANWMITSPPDGVTGKAETYRNGVDLRGVETFDNDDDFASFDVAATGLRIGTWNHNAAREWKGRLELMVIFDSVQVNSAHASSLTSNPWQIFKPRLIPINTFVAAVGGNNILRQRMRY